MWPSNIPSDLKEGIEPPNNQPASISYMHRIKGKEYFICELPVVDEC